MSTEPADDSVYGRPVETPQSRMAGQEAPPRAAPIPADGGKPPGVPEAPHEGAPPADAEQQVCEQPEAVYTTTAGHEDEVSD